MNLGRVARSLLLVKVKDGSKKAQDVGSKLERRRKVPNCVLGDENEVLRERKM